MEYVYSKDDDKFIVKLDNGWVTIPAEIVADMLNHKIKVIHEDFWNKDRADQESRKLREQAPSA